MPFKSRARAKNQQKMEQKKILNNRITEAYIESGLVQMQYALSEYGTNVAFALSDSGIWSKRAEMKDNYDILKKKLLEIRNRPIVNQVINRRFELATKTFPYIRQFNSSLFNSIFLTLQHWSNYSDDITWRGDMPWF